MTYNEFLDKLRATPRKWKLGNQGRIRMCIKNRDHCPISFIGHGELSNPRAWGKKINLRDSVITKIIEASDNQIWPTDFYTLKIRRNLLAACGLKEVE